MMSKLKSRNFKAFSLLGWIEENKGQLKPPVNNKMLWEESDFIYMMVGGRTSAVIFMSALPKSSFIKSKAPVISK